jgi:hypothetical protein
MGSRIVCFMLLPTDCYEIGLRRFTFSTPDAALPCAARYGIHNAYVQIGREHYSEQPTIGDFGYAHDDPRWPRTCDACGTPFFEDDPWQVVYHQFYRRGDNGALVTLEHAPPGAMWDADYLLPSYAGPDGRSLVLRTPGGDWLIDRSPSGQKGVGGWQRTGEPPKVTARPSIQITNPPGPASGGLPSYHGFLTAGVLEEC